MTAVGLVAAGGAATRRSGSRMAGDIALLTGGTMVAAALGVVQVFLIPRLLSVQEYGYWRLFLLYAGYAGLAHMGLADGALLRWAGRPLEEFRGEIAGCLRLLLLQHAALGALAVAGVLWWLREQPALRTIGLAVAGFAVVVNAATLLQYALQAGRRFRPVAVAAVAPMALFLAVVGACSLRGVVSARLLMASYAAAWMAVLAYLAWEVRPRGRAAAGRIGRKCVRIGWAVVLSNTGFGLVAGADRLVLSKVASLEEFAQYSLAASTTFVPLTAIAAVSRAFFPHLAATPGGERREVYRRAARLIVLGWVAMLPYYLAVEAFVRRFLPAYEASLPVAGVLLGGTVFFALIQILQMSAFNLCGRQREFLASVAAFVAVGFAASYVAFTRTGSLAMVAAAQVATAAACWAANAWALRGSVARRAAAAICNEAQRRGGELSQTKARVELGS